MYGLVNRALQQLVSARCGDEVWQKICKRAAVDDEVFVRMDFYPDEITQRLLAAASDELNMPAAQLLEEFGCHWMRYTAVEGYGALLNDLGATFQQALNSLNGMHERVSLLYPALRSPRFRCEALEAGAMRLHYWSERRGFAPMIIGLVEGLAERYGLLAKVIHDQQRDEGHDHDSFIIRLSELHSDVH